MKTKISVADAARLNGCEPGLSRATRVLSLADISVDSEIEFDVALSLAIKHKKNDLVDFMTKNKAALLEYTDEKFDCYIFNQQEFYTIEDVRIAVETLRQERIKFHKELTVVAFSESLGEDSTWTAIDIDKFEIPSHITNFHFHVFEHKKGSYVECATVDDVKNKINEIVQSCMDSESVMFQVFCRYVYGEDGVTTATKQITLNG
jgi:hypothetical protein